MSHRHADPPALCAECLAAGLAEAPSHGGRLVWIYCPHSPPGAALRIEFQGGVAVQYQMTGPMDAAGFERLQAAEELACATLEARRPPGGRDN